MDWMRWIYRVASLLVELEVDAADIDTDGLTRDDGGSNCAFLLSGAPSKFKSAKMSRSCH